MKLFKMFRRHLFALALLLALPCESARSWTVCPDKSRLEYKIWNPDPRMTMAGFNYYYYKKTWLIPISQPLVRIDYSKTLHVLSRKSLSTFDKYYYLTCTLDGPVNAKDYFQKKVVNNFFYTETVGTFYPSPSFNCQDSRGLTSNIEADNSNPYLLLSQSDGSRSWFKIYFFTYPGKGAFRDLVICDEDKAKSRMIKFILSEIDQVFLDSNNQIVEKRVENFLAYTIYETPLITQATNNPVFSGF